MKREIKFRAWHKKLNVMLPNIHNQVYNKEWTFGQILSSANTEVMQFTGLKDKNGREIYEGDILSVETHRGILKCGIEWNNKVCCYDWYVTSSVKRVASDLCRSIEEAPKVMNRPFRDLCEVIGNIYENPELLGKEQGNA